jgi:hypothetical protein
MKFVKYRSHPLFLYHVQEAFSSEPADLRSGISPYHIALFILERPGQDNDDVTLTDPRPLFHLTPEPAHPRRAVHALDGEVACSEQFYDRAEHFSRNFIRGPYSCDDLAYTTRRLPATTVIWSIQIITLLFCSYFLSILSLVSHPCISRRSCLS